MWWAQMWHHTLLTGWDLKTVCILENGKLLWSTFHLQLHFSIIRDLSILRGIFPHKRYQLLTLLISLWTASWVRTWVHGKKDRKKQEPSFFWENKDESAVLCELNPAFAMNHGSSCFILTFSSLWSLISSLSQLLSCKNEISYLKDKRWKLPKLCFTFSEQAGFRERCTQADSPGKQAPFSAAGKDKRASPPREEKTWKGFLEGWCSWETANSQLNALSASKGCARAQGASARSHPQEDSADTPRVEREEGAALAAHTSACNHRCKFKNLFQRQWEARWVSTSYTVLGAPTTKFQTQRNPNRIEMTSWTTCAHLPPLLWATGAGRGPGAHQDFHPNRGKQRETMRDLPQAQTCQKCISHYSKCWMDAQIHTHTDTEEL